VKRYPHIDLTKDVDWGVGKTKTLVLLGDSKH
jgi:hypothetical protein